MHKAVLRDFNGNPVAFYRVNLTPILSEGVEEERKPSHHIMVLDASWSMYGIMEDLKNRIEKMLVLSEFAEETLRFSVLSYASSGDVKVHFDYATAAEITAAQSPHMKQLRGVQPRGLTGISQGLRRALELVRPGEATAVSLHSDGYANDPSPSTERKKCIELAKALAEKGVVVNTIAHSDWSDFALLDAIALEGSGSCTRVYDAKQTYETLVNTTIMISGDLAPAINVGIGSADFGLYYSPNKVVGSNVDFTVRGVPSDAGGVVLTFTEVNADFDASEIPLEGYYALTRLFIAQGQYNKAKFALVSTKNESLLSSHYRALTNSEIAAFASSVEQRLSSPNPQDRFTSDYGMKKAPVTVLELMQFLNSNKDQIRVHLPRLKKAYHRTGISRVAGKRDEEGALQVPEFDLRADADTLVSIGDVGINRNAATINLRVDRPAKLFNVNTGEEIREVAGVPLNDLKLYNSHTVVKDGAVNLHALAVQTPMKRVFNQLRDWGLVGGDFDPNANYEINISDLPVINFDANFEVRPESIQLLYDLTVLNKILSGVLKSDERPSEYTEDQKAELKRHHLSESLYFNPPTTTPYTSLEEAMKAGQVDAYNTYKVEVGTPSISNLSHLKSGNAYLQRRFDVEVNGEKEKKPTLGMWWDPTVKFTEKKLSVRTKLDEVDAQMMPMFEAFLGLNSDGMLIPNLCHEMGFSLQEIDRIVEAIEKRVEDQDLITRRLNELAKRVDLTIKRIYEEEITPLAFYIGATGLVPFEGAAMDAEELTQKYPNLKLSKKEREEGVFYVVDDVLISVYTEQAYRSL